MTTFLCFRLHGPLASWGDVAVGERRPTSPHLSRSAVLGLVAAALGVRRDDQAGWAALELAFGFASRTDAPGELLVDFHTAQGPDEKLLRAAAGAAKRAKVPWHRPATRREELAFTRQALATLLSMRQYRVDASWTAALWLRLGVEQPPWSLARVQEALRRPQFVPYLGRKSCPLDLPMEPQLVEAGDPVAAMARAGFRTDEFLAPVIARATGKGTVQWEGAWPGLAAPLTIRRRDRVSSRSRWQFAEREEHQAPWNPQEGEAHVPEQS
jgi:CRISPR system Cascade subunit CasD